MGGDLRVRQAGDWVHHRHRLHSAGVAEELVATKAFLIRAGLFKDVDVVLGVHVADEFATGYGQTFAPQGLVSVQYFFHGKASHAAGAPWDGRSALDAVELMDTGWNFRRRSEE